VSSDTANKGFVAVTGTSTGIGAATALHLAHEGFHVFAGVRRPQDGDALRMQAGDGVTPVLIDVTDQATIEAARATVASVVGDRGLAGLVNNAGIAKPAPIEFQPLADFRLQLEVNLLGPVAMIQAFLPEIRRGDYTLTKQSGRVADAMAKALEARGCEVAKALIEFRGCRSSRNFR